MFDGVGIYIDALESEDVSLAITFSNAPYSIISDIKEELVGLSTGNVGKVLAERVLSILKSLRRELRLKELRSVVVVIDEVIKALGIDRVERYLKRLYEFL